MNCNAKETESNEMPHLKIVRQFNVAPEVVFDAFTIPQSMKIWWTDDTTFDIDLRVGGRWTITRKEGDTVYTMTGEYLEINRPQWLKFSISMPQFSANSDIISIEITPEEFGCIFTFVQTGEDIASELRELSQESISESEKGWQQGFDLMAAAREK